MSRLYISQNNKDTDLARLLAARLQLRGHSVAVDLNVLVPGTEWMRSIREESAACDGIIALLSANQRWSRTAELLRRVAEQYGREAESEDREAELRKDGFW